jgi:DNA-binding Lrp family transcriptional regulator
MQPTIPLDRLDFRILLYLQRKGHCSNVELADAVGLSPSPCLLRTKRLQECGIIRGHRLDIALEKLGDHVVVFCELTLQSHQIADFKKFEREAGQHPEIVECYNVSGGYDYLLKVIAPSVMYFQSLMDTLIERNVGIQKFASRIVLRKPFDQRVEPIEAITLRKRWGE